VELKLPFPVNRRGVEVPPTKPAETDEGNDKPTTTWEALSQVPFMSPNDD
jgi:hypothetical protein